MSRTMFFAGLSGYAVFALASAMIGAVDQLIDLGILAAAFREPLSFVVETLSNFVALFIDIDLGPIIVVMFFAMYVISLFTITLLSLKPGVGFWAFVFAIIHLILIFPLGLLFAASKPWFSKFEVPKGWLTRMFGGIVFSVLVVLLIIGYATLGAVDLDERLASVNPCLGFFGDNRPDNCLGEFLGLDALGGESGDSPMAIAFAISVLIGFVVVFFLPAGLAIGHKLRVKRMFGRVFLAAAIAAAVSVASLVFEQTQFAEAGPQHPETTTDHG